MAQNKAAIEARREAERMQAELLAKKLAGVEIVIEQLAGDDERLFGSVTSADIVAKFAAQDVQIDKKQILLAEPIKTLGTYTVPVKTGFQVTTEITIKVIRSAA